MQITITRTEAEKIFLEWTHVPKAASYRLLMSDSGREGVEFIPVLETEQNRAALALTTCTPRFFRVEALDQAGKFLNRSGVAESPVRKVFHPFYEKLGRGLVACRTDGGIFLSWRFLRSEWQGHSSTGLTGKVFRVFRNGSPLALVSDSTNYLDPEGTLSDHYQVAAEDPVTGSREAPCEKVAPLADNYLEIPLRRPEGGVTPAGEKFVYHANDMSVGDVNGDGEYEFFLKWDPSNSHDVSHKGYTGRCLIDCFTREGTLLWRLDMGPNIRAGAHYTQFIVMDFNLDGRAEMAVKTAPGTRMTRYAPDGSVLWEKYITLPEEDVRRGITHRDNYVCSAADYREHMIRVFMEWDSHREVLAGHWPKTVEKCFGIADRYPYPLSRENASALADYFIHEYAPSRSPRNDLTDFEGFIFEGPEYLTMFSGLGDELETIPFPFPREDDGLMWGDYAMRRIEPCNRVDRFLAGAAYLDGERPFLIMSRGYYTRSCVAAYSFFENRFKTEWTVDSGYPVMDNPFRCAAHALEGRDPVYGTFAGQGNHSLSTADVDGDGKQEVVYGAAVLDQDGSLLYSSYDHLPNGKRAKLGHGDSFHVAKIDPDRPGLQIFNVFEGAENAPYGWALRDAATGRVFFGEYAETDLGRCMIGKICSDVRGWQVWADGRVFDCRGRELPCPAPGTNQGIRWAADLTTQVTDFNYNTGEKQRGVINDPEHGIMLDPGDTLTNNTTKGNPCLVADVFGDFRENLILRTEDDSAIRIYISTEVTHHKLFTLMHDLQYRSSIAWQNNCYNQTGYPSFYYGPDMDWGEVR